MKKAKKAVALPSGFTDTSGGGEFPRAWNPKPGDMLQGIVMDKRAESAKKLKYDKPKPGQMVTILSIADKDNGEIVGVFESYALGTFCKEAKKGDEVFLILDEIKKIGKKSLKVFRTGIKKGKGK